uniref:Cilia- and flagella-associated protein 299 n=1 Tax=Steinernema glaseri TaxID=37863 RepID=A0A1I8A393_9BILA
MTEELNLVLSGHSPRDKIYFVLGEKVSKRERYSKAALILNRASLDYFAATINDQKRTICRNSVKTFDLHKCFASGGFKKVDVDEDLQGKNRYLHARRHLSPTEYTEHTRLGIYDDGRSIFNNLSRDILAFFNLRKSELVVYELLLYGLERSHLAPRATFDED